MFKSNFVHVLFKMYGTQKKVTRCTVGGIMGMELSNNDTKISPRNKLTTRSTLFTRYRSHMTHIEVWLVRA